MQHLVQRGALIESRAWGSGAEWLTEQLPVLLGANDDAPFPKTNAFVHDLASHYYGMRIPRTNAVWESLLPAILEQKVTGKEARASFRSLQRRYGEAAPAPANGPSLQLPLNPDVVARLAPHDLMQANVERKRGDAIRMCASYARRAEECVKMTIDDARDRLGMLPGVGAWTVAEVCIRALGDADAVSVGDFHLKNYVAWNLAGKARGTDDEMLELLEPFRPHRGRVLLLLQLGGATPPRYGPRLSIQRRW